MNTRRINSACITVLTLLAGLIVIMSFFTFQSSNVYAADRRVYFDNYYTQFDTVALQAYDDFDADREQYIMQDVGKGFLAADIPDEYEKVSVRYTLGGYGIINGRCGIYVSLGNGACDYWDDEPHLITNDNLIIPTNLETVTWGKYEGYNRTKYTKQYEEPDYDYEHQPSFNEPASNITELTSSGVNLLSGNREGIGWKYKDGILYLNEELKGDFPIKAKGDLTIIVSNGCLNISAIDVSDRLTLSVMGGILNTKKIKSSQMNINISSFATLNNLGMIRATDININTRKNGKLNNIHEKASTQLFLQFNCDSLTINGEGTNEVNAIMCGGGPEEISYNVQNNCALNNVALAAFTKRWEIPLKCNGTITENNASHDTTTHKYHYAGDWIEVQKRANDRGINGVKIKRCILCGQVVDVSVDYYDDYNVDKFNMSLSDKEYVYTGNPIYPELNVPDRTKDKDYKVEYKDNTNEGTAKVIITGIGDYFGTVEIPFNIVRYPIDNMMAAIPQYSYDYTGESICPKVTINGLTENKDYTVEYKQNTEEGTAKIIITGIIAYKGTQEITFQIVRYPIEEKTASIPETTYVYTGEPICPKVSIDGLVEGADFTVHYENNDSVGTAKAIVSGINKYKGTQELFFQITRLPITDKEVTVPEDTYLYTGDPIRPEVTIEGLTEGKDFEVEYSNNVDEGKATIKVTGIVAYEGEVELSFFIIDNKKYIDYGACGEDCVWTMTGNFALSIKGSGEVPDFSKGAGNAPWSEYSQKVTSIAIENGIEKIDSNAFSDCTNAAQIYIPATVVEIGENAFSDDTTSIVRSLYIEDADSFAQIDFKNEASSPISWCNKLYIDNKATTSVILSDAVKQVSPFAFENATVIKELNLPSSLTEIGESAFANTSVAEFKTDNECIVAKNAFAGCNTLTIADFKSNGAVGERAFNGCTALTDVSITGSNVVLSKSSFSECPELKNVQISECKQIVTGSFEGSFKSSGASFTIRSAENGNCQIGERTFENATGLETVDLQGDFDAIRSFTFKGCTGLKNVTIPEGIVGIDNQAFCYCSSLDNVTIPSSVDIIGMFAFYNCSSIQNLVIGDGVRIIGLYAFCGCCGLNQVTIPDSITEIGDGAFMYSVDSDVNTGLEAPSTRSGFVFDNWYTEPEFEHVVNFENLGGDDEHVNTQMWLGSGEEQRLFFKLQTILPFKLNAGGITIYSKWNMLKKNPITAQGKTVKIKYTKLKKKTQTIKAAKAITVAKYQGLLTYKLTAVKKSKYKKYFTMNSKSGKLTVKKGLKKGKYKITVKVTASGNKSFKAGSKTATITIKVY